jgi:hypothetical protein
VLIPGLTPAALTPAVPLRLRVPPPPVPAVKSRTPLSLLLVGEHPTSQTAKLASMCQRASA